MDYYRKSYNFKKRFFLKPSWMMLIFILTLSIFVYLVNLYNQKINSAETISPISSYPLKLSVTPTPKIEISILPKIKNQLSSVVQNSLPDFNGEIGIAIKNLETGEFFYSNEHSSMQTASLYKLWVMATVYDQIQKGIINEDQVLSESVTILNSKFDIDNENAELTSGTITLSVKNALNRMITLSDNYAALLLSEKIGLTTVANFLVVNNFPESSVGNTGGSPKSNALDMLGFFEKLYSGKIADADATKKMLDLLKDQKKNNKLPKYLDQSVSIAHKTGELGTFSHDAGIVYLQNSTYIIVIMTDSPNPTRTEDLIAQLSKNVYDYFKD